MTSAPAADPLRIGFLGASRIAVESVIGPARAAGARLVAVASRDRHRAERFAADYGVERVAAGYEQLLSDPEVEVIYNGLPNSLHASWNLAAIAAGKHVLAEKPFASNAAEARGVAAAADASNQVVFDAFHHRYHPIFARFLAAISSGEIGALQSLRVQMLTPAPADDDLRWSLPLAGGATMDLGCYFLNVFTAVAQAQGGRLQLTSAEMGERAGRPGVDEWCRIGATLPSGATAEGYADMANPGWDFSIHGVGETGEVTVANFVKVSSDDRFILRRPDGTDQVEHLGTRSSYHYQLDALTAAIRQGTAFPTDAADGVLNLELIDESYCRAGLEPRPSATAESGDNSRVS